MSGLSLGATFGRDFGLYRAGVEGAFSAYKPTNIIYNLPNWRISPLTCFR